MGRNVRSGPSHSSYAILVGQMTKSKTIKLFNWSGGYLVASCRNSQATI